MPPEENTPEPLTQTDPQGESLPTAVEEALARTVERTEAAIAAATAPLTEAMTALQERVSAVESAHVAAVAPAAEHALEDDDPPHVIIEHEVERGPLRMLHDAIG